MSRDDSVLLEHLAATGWFLAHGEVALTGGLTFCLTKDPEAAQAFVDLIRDRLSLTKNDVPSDIRWQAEWTDEQRARIDVSGWADTDDGQAPVVFVEGKISAAFAPRQISDYVVKQQERLHDAGRSRGACVVLVPEIRARMARDEVEVDLKAPRHDGQRLEVIDRGQSWLVNGEAAVTVTVVSWDETLDAMLAAAEAAKCDLEQLRGACRALQGADVAAFTDADLADGRWRDRRKDLELVIDRLSREAIAQLSMSVGNLPWQPRAFAGLEGGYRYIGQFGLPNLAVGTRTDGTPPPLWVRWHPNTADIRLVEPRLTRAGHVVRKDDDGLWLPLELKPDIGSATRQIGSLVSQVIQLYKVAVAWPEPI